MVRGTAVTEDVRSVRPRTLASSSSFAEREVVQAAAAAIDHVLAAVRRKIGGWIASGHGGHREDGQGVVSYDACAPPEATHVVVGAAVHDVMGSIGGNEVRGWIPGRPGRLRVAR